MPDGRAVGVVVTTYFPPGPIGADRVRATSHALSSWWGYLSAPWWDIVIADDGSAAEHIDTFMAERPAVGIVRTQRLGCGGALNAGLRYILDHGSADVVMYCQDDWAIGSPLDLAPSLTLLNSGVADIVRLGPTHPGLAAHVVRTAVADGEWCLEYDWAGGGYVVGWRPALYHRRVFERFPLDGLDGLSAIEGERVWLESMAADPNPPRVFHAPNCTLAGPFRHIDTVELGEDAPDVLTARYA